MRTLVFVTGFRERAVQCVRLSDSTTMPLRYCITGKVATSEPCHETCTRHCELSAFSDWSECSATCGMGALRSRERRIKRHARRGGRQCPGRATLTQVRRVVAYSLQLSTLCAACESVVVHEHRMDGRKCTHTCTYLYVDIIIIPREAKGYGFGLVGLSVCLFVRHALFYFLRL